MLNWKEIVQNYIIKYSDLIQKTTKPLHDHFGIDYFTYHHIDEAGQYTVLVDRPDWAEHYVSEQIYLNDPYLRHPSVYQSGITLIENHGSQEYKELILKSGKEMLNVDMGAILIQKKDKNVEFFGFSGNKKTSCLESLYLNHTQVLTSFASHFRNQLKPILKQMREEAGSLIALKGDDFICNQMICPEISLNTLLAYYQDLGMSAEIEKAAKLSMRERQCLQLLIEDKSAKEIAAHLNLSRRTVEHYFENIKNKINCWSKQDLLQMAKLFKEMGLL